MSTYSLDDLDRGILRELEEDGRRAFREIGRTLGTSEATIRARVKRLQDLNVLRIVAFADPNSLGTTQLALVFLDVDPADHERVIEAVCELPEATYVSTVMGRFDICVELLVTDNAALWKLINERIGRITGVRNVETNSIMRVHKLRYATPV
ncbi:Lrp/AsnC family transcriptional regulator [Gordonia sp. CPCC 205515]|uniref:Lrp/AsnC family transcriptional regulator n=1 Tax=Gordonia sp. CPCC 205515 TaxID=3140791 RepID=UPI003AF3D894